MALKDTWRDKVDNVDEVRADDINSIARAVIKNEEDTAEALTLSQTQGEEIVALKATTRQNAEQANKNKEGISKNDKRLTNLEKGLIPEPFMTDDSVSYTKEVPFNALPYAALNKIGGMTYKDGDTLKSAKVTEVESVGVNVNQSLPIPEAVQALDGYGLGVSAYQNDVIWANDGRRLWNKAATQAQFTGNESWYLDRANSHGAYVYRLQFREKKSEEGTMLCDQFEYASGAWGEKGVGYFADSLNGGIYFNTIFASAAGWKAYLAEQYASGTPVTIVYALATPEITDISYILPEDNFIAVEGGGTLTFKNEYGYDVPSEVTYMLNGETL